MDAAFDRGLAQDDGHVIAAASERIRGVGQVGKFSGRGRPGFENEQRGFEYRLGVAPAVARDSGALEG